MRFLFWITLFVLALLGEVAVLPNMVGQFVPVISFAVLVVGIAWQEFWSGLFFVGLAGILRDSISPVDTVSHTLFFVIVFLLMRLFIALSAWDEPARRIGAIVGTFVLLPLSWNMSSLIMRALFHVSPPLFYLSDIHSRWFLVNSIVTSLWLLLLSWSMVRRQRKYRLAIASRIS
jgi:hypothetical protein